MNIRQKLLLGAGLLAAIPVVLTATFLWISASRLSSETISAQTQAQLVGIRESRRQALTDEFNARAADVATLAAQRSTLDAFRALKAGYETAAKDIARLDPAAANTAMTAFIEQQFKVEFARRNADAMPDLSKAVAARDANSVALQAAYITSNPNPLGQKDKLSLSPIDFAYGRAHAQYHPSFERGLKLQGFYDFFLVDTETDNVIYTVFKELDFATNLATGIAAKTKLAETYETVKRGGKRDATFLSDFAPYIASYNDQAAFVGVPLFDGDKQVAVLLAQYPIDRISDVMSAGRAWGKIGLGSTGDVFVVGADKKIRSVARYLIENKEAFGKRVADKMSPAELQSMLKKESSVGLVTIDTDATRPALEGQEGFVDFIDYRGVRALGAYAPLKVQGLNWGLVAQIDHAEATAPLAALNRAALVSAAAVGLAVLLGAGLLVTWFLRRFLKPIDRLAATVNEVAAGNVEARSRLTDSDEIGDLGRSFDRLLDERIAALEASKKENEQINNSVIALLQTVFQLSNRDLTVRAPVTADVVGTVSSSVNQLADETGRTLYDVRVVADEVRSTSAALRERSIEVEDAAQKERESLVAMSNALTETSERLGQVADLSQQSNYAAEQAVGATQSAMEAVESAVGGMDTLRESISDLEKRFKRLGERSQDISAAVALVNTISERTHVLALNAAMQAATAGEAGRGFAVVAEEVQRLSESSRQATAQISQLVSNIQGETNETVFTVNRLIADVVQQSDLAQLAGVQMAQTKMTTQELVELVRQIAALGQNQNELAQLLQQSVTDLSDGATRTSVAITEQTQSTQRLVAYSERLTSVVGLFKLPGVENATTNSTN